MASKANATKITLYSYWRSSCSWRVRTALNYKGVPYEIKTVNLFGDQQQHSESYKKISPMGFVPALQIDGKTLVESISILQFIEEKWPEKPLLPKDLFERAKVREICEIIASGIQPLQNLAIEEYLHNKGVNTEGFPQYWISRGFDALEKILGESAGKYCVGDNITFADLCLIPQIFNARRYKVDLKDFPIILKIDGELANHPSFKSAHPHSQPDCPPEELN